MNNFVSSRSMITPGIAGSATTMITGTLVTTFGFPGAVTALVVSFVFGLMVLADESIATIYYKFIFYIISSVTIFSVAVGLNQAGMAIVERDRQVSTIEERSLSPAEDKNDNALQAEPKPFFQEWF